LGEKNKIPSIVTQIKTQPVKEVNYGFQKSISYSQLSMYSSCPHKWALQYRDGHKYSESSIHMTFGTSLHETLQHYITTIYEITGAEADRINLRFLIPPLINQRLSNKWFYQGPHQLSGNQHRA
jgi:hypothetical protein